MPKNHTFFRAFSRLFSNRPFNISFDSILPNKKGDSSFIINTKNTTNNTFPPETAISKIKVALAGSPLFDSCALYPIHDRALNDSISLIIEELCPLLDERLRACDGMSSSCENLGKFESGVLDDLVVKNFSDPELENNVTETAKTLFSRLGILEERKF